MRRVLIAMGGMLMLAGCGGSDGSGGSVSVVSGAATPTPTPTPVPTATPTPVPTPTPTPTPAPTPSSSYTRYADLTGNQTFGTACASLLLGTSLPTPQPALPFGEALVLGFTASTGGWSVNGDNVAQSFPASDSVSAPAGQKIYQHGTAGSLQQLAITEPTTSGAASPFVRTLSLRTDRGTGTALYSCSFGVPALAADVPQAAVGYGKVTVTGTAYVQTSGGGSIQSYALTGSTATLSYDPAGNAMTVTLHMIGTAAGSSTMTDLGTYTSAAAVTAAKVRFAGQINSSSWISQFSSLSGAFFGNTDAGLAFEVLATDPATGNKVAATGTVAASR